MLTAASTVAARVEGLGLGADDYLSKPFDFAELVARVRDMEPAQRRPAVPPVLDCCGVRLDPGGRVAFREGCWLDPSPRSSRCWSAC